MSVPDHCLSFYFSLLTFMLKLGITKEHFFCGFKLTPIWFAIMTNDFRDIYTVHVYMQIRRLTEA